MNCPARGDLPEEHDLVQVLSVGLFDGVGALRVACDVLGLPMAGHVTIEQEPISVVGWSSPIFQIHVSIKTSAASEGKRSRLWP